ncbi:type IV pilus assembly protein PilM [Candidatus Omnitrophota bacterium]
MMKKIAGIDIGNHSIKLIELEYKQGQFELTRSCIKRIVGGNAKSTLADLISETKLPLKRVNVSLSGPSVIVRYIKMPSMKEEELKSAIEFEADKYIPFNLNDSIVDCAILDKAASGTQRVLLVAAKKSEVMNLLALFKDVGLEINTVDIDSFAFLNSFHRLKAKESKGEHTYALINMGARFSNMNIVTKGSIYFTRDVLWGGSDITNRLRDAMGISLEEAEKTKQNPAKKQEEIGGIITPVLERLASQVRMSFDYFESQFGKNVERLYISGGTSYLFNIVDFLKDNLGVDTMMWNPFEGMKISESLKEAEYSPAIFAVAVGLALRR